MPAPDPNPDPQPPPGPARAFIALGGNVGDVRASFTRALALLRASPGLRLLAVSSLYRTAPVGPIAQPDYLNAAALATSDLPAHALLDRLQQVERELGRDRAAEQRWGPRTLDLDLLIYGDLRLDRPGLTVPHPRLAERRFVLAPLADLDPSLRPPGADATVAELLVRLPDDGGLTMASVGPAWASSPAAAPG